MYLKPVSTNPLVFFENYQKLAPFTLALWRSSEAAALAKYKFQQPLLDVGCGFGEFAQAFFDKKIDVGLDIDWRDLHQCNDSKMYKTLIQADGQKMPLSNESFNTVMAMSVIEHIDNPKMVMAEAYRVLKPGGNFIFSVPTSLINSSLFLSQVFNQLGMTKMQKKYLQMYHKTFKHKVIKPKKWWLGQCESSGFIVKEVSPTITIGQLHGFELTIPFSIPSQIIRIITGKRKLVQMNIADDLMRQIWKPVVVNQKFIDVNIAILCQKK